MPEWLERLIKERSLYSENIAKLRYALANHNQFKIPNKQLELMNIQLSRMNNLTDIINQRINEGIKPTSNIPEKVDEILNNVGYYDLKNNSEPKEFNPHLSKIRSLKEALSETNNLTLEERIENLANLNKTEIPKEPNL